MVILTECAWSDAIQINQFCRQNDVRFICGDIFGLVGYSFVDVGDHHEVTDGDGESVNEIPIGEISLHNSPPGFLITTLDSEPHELQEGDVVTLRNVQGFPPQAELKVTRVEKKDKFIVEGASHPPVGVNLGSFLKEKKPFLVASKSLELSLQHPRLLGSDWTKCQSMGTLFGALRILEAYRASHGGAFPRPWNEQDAGAFLSLASKYFPLDFEDTLFGPSRIDAPDESVLLGFAHTARGSLQPLCALFGGIIGQEAQKAISGKFTPQQGFLLVDAMELLASKSPSFQPQQFVLSNDRMDSLRICVGGAVADALSRQSLFMIGVGAIGCELLKNFAMLGVATQGDAVLHMTDPDLIEKSNLNRQFLFRPQNIKQPKATTAATAVKAMNGSINVVAALDKISEDTEAKYSDDFFGRMSIIVNALDNVAARRYVDGRCVANGKPLLESGTLGTKGHVQVIIPHLTCSYTDIRDPPAKDIPFCTLKSFPSKIEHCIEWSRDLAFDKQFVQKPSEFNKILQDANLVSNLLAHPQGPTFTKTLKRALKLVETRPHTFDDCISFARLKFEAYYANAAKQLLHLFPLTHTVKDAATGKESLFWTPPKNPPTPIVWSAADPLHVAFVQNYANLHALMWRIPHVHSRDAAYVASVASKVHIPVFVPKDGKRVETDPSKAAPTAAASSSSSAAETVPTDRAEFERVLRSLGDKLPSVRSSLETQALFVQEFEKDDDSNFHIDFIAACANLRGVLYQIKPVDRLEAKRIAGRIIPAIATTTSVVSAHVALELVKIVCGASLSDYRNLTTNLALPFYLYSEPDPAAKHKIGDVHYTKWDTWDVRLGLDVPVGAVIGHFKTHYGLQVQSIVYGAGIVFHEDFMPDTESSMRDCLQDIPSGSKFVVLVVMFSGEGNEVLSGPAVRYFLKGATKKRKTNKKADETSKE